MTTALSLPTLPSSVTGPSYIPDLTETADIQQALKLLYYGSGGTLSTSNGIYGALTGLKNYVDASISGVNVHEVVKYATTTTIAGVYAAGTTDASGGTGVGAKITFSSTGVQQIDTGSNLALNDRVLVKNGVTADSGINSKANGIYYVSTAPAVGVAGVLTRALDSDNSVAGEMGEGDFTFVTDGTTQGNTSWVLTSSSATGTGPTGSIKIGTDPVTFIQFGAVSWANQTANTFFAGPTSGAASTPAFRTLNYQDLSTNNTPATSGQLPYYSATGNGVSWTTSTYPSTVASQSILYGNGANVVGTLAMGTANQVLAVNAGGTAIAWTTIASSFTGGTLTSNLTLATGTNSLVPLKFQPSTFANLPTAANLSNGSVSSATDGIYAATNPGTTTTGPGLGLVRAPQMVYTLAQSGTSTTGATAVFAAANDVLSVLEPAKLYRFKGMYPATLVSYAGSSSAISLIFSFSNAPASIFYTYKSWSQSGAAQTPYLGASSAATSTTVSTAMGAGGAIVIEFEGYFISHATLTSTLTPQFAGSSGSSTVAVSTGAWIEIEKLGTSTQTLIAGNWA